ADVLRRPSMNEKEMARIKADTLTALKQRYDAPANIASDLIEKALYGEGHRRASPSIGTAEAVKLLDHFDCRWWHRERLRPDDGALIVVGDVDQAALKSLLQTELAAWKAPGKRKELPLLSKVPAPSRRLWAVDLPGKTQTALAIGEPSVPRN